MLNVYVCSIGVCNGYGYYNLSCTGSIWAVKLHWLDKFLLYTVTDQNIAFLVPDSCWATERNGNSNSISDDAFENI
jgi:hypothetical protein